MIALQASENVTEKEHGSRTVESRALPKQCPRICCVMGPEPHKSEVYNTPPEILCWKMNSRVRLKPSILARMLGDEASVQVQRRTNAEPCHAIQRC